MYLPGSLYSIILLLYSWGSLFGVPIKVPLRVAVKGQGRGQGYPGRDGFLAKRSLICGCLGLWLGLGSGPTT